ncbi:MAG TPA: alpha/beta hydrolase [Gaiellaceae bacterium]
MGLVSWLLFGLLAALAAGCGGGGAASRYPPGVQEGPFGQGAGQVWFYAAKGKPRSLVVFLHGYGGPTEETPVNHVAWLQHLAAEGSDVIYPRYEVGASMDPFADLEAGVSAALQRLGNPKAPEVVIGYSRGGRIAVDYAAIEASQGHEPRAVLAVFPGLSSPYERLGPLQKLDSRTKIVIMVGDRDTGVGGVGAHALLVRLAYAKFPADRIQIIGVKSRPGFSATHVSVLETSAGARNAFWKPADRLIDSVR